MATLNRRRGHGEGGQAIVELALTLPLLMLVVLGVFDFGFMFQEYEVVTNAAREGARVAVLPGYTAADAESHTSQYLAAGKVTGAVVSVQDVDVTVSTSPVRTVRAVRVTVDYAHPHEFVGPILDLFGNNLRTTHIRAVSTMRKEGS